MNSRLKSLIEVFNESNEFHEDEASVKADMRRYIMALEEGRMIVSIDNISRDGMGREMKFAELSKDKLSDGRRIMRQFSSLFEIMGYTEGKKLGYYRINGGGMDMVFAVNQRICREIRKCGVVGVKRELNAIQLSLHVI